MSITFDRRATDASVRKAERYYYVAHTQDAQIVSGSQRGSEATVRAELVGKRALFVSYLSRRPPILQAPAGKDRIGHFIGTLWRSSKLYSGLPRRDLMWLFEHLSFSLANSTTVVAPLEASAKDTESDHLRGILTSIAYTAKKKNFAAAFEEFKDEFPVEVIGLLKFGQRLNKLPLACATLAKYFARSERTSAAVWNVLAYPIAMITLIGGLMAAFILIGTPMIVDQFRVMNKTIAIEPPLDTYYALAMIARNPLVDLLGLALLAIIISGAVWYSKREEVQNFYSSVRFKAGVFGTIVRESNQARIADLLSACVEFGLQEHEYLPLLRDSSRDRTYRHALDEMVANQRQNKTKVELLFDAPEIMGRKLFDRLFVSTVAKIKDGKSKDGTGAATMLASLAEHKFRWVDSIVHRLRTIIEPALIVFLVIIAGFLAWTVFAPLYQMILNLTNSGSGGG